LSAVGDYRRAMVAGDLDGVVAAMSPDVVLNSPITERHQFRGHDELREVYAAVLAEVTEIEYDREIVDGSTCVLTGSGSVRGQYLEETLLIELDGTGAIAEITLYVRPMPGLLALAAALAPHVGPSRGRSRLAGLLARPLAAAGRSGDRAVTRLVWPR
jgi:hypothetical protein